MKIFFIGLLLLLSSVTMASEDSHLGQLSAPPMSELDDALDELIQETNNYLVQVGSDLDRIDDQLAKLSKDLADLKSEHKDFRTTYPEYSGDRNLNVKMDYVETYDELEVHGSPVAIAP